MHRWLVGRFDCRPALPCTGMWGTLRLCPPPPTSSAHQWIIAPLSAFVPEIPTSFKRFTLEVQIRGRRSERVLPAAHNCPRSTELHEVFFCCGRSSRPGACLKVLEPGCPSPDPGNIVKNNLPSQMWRGVAPPTRLRVPLLLRLRAGVHSFISVLIVVVKGHLCSSRESSSLAGGFLGSCSHQSWSSSR